MARAFLICGIILNWMLSPAHAVEQTLSLDPAATKISFTLGSTLHTVHGTLQLDEGTIVFDDELGTASGGVVIDAASAETGNRKRDKKMHHKVLASETHPLIVFTPQKMQHRLVDDGSGRILLGGTVSVHGVEHAVDLDATVSRRGQRITASFDLPVPFVEWGMEDPSVFVFRTDKEVLVHVDLQGTLEVTP